MNEQKFEIIRETIMAFSKGMWERYIDLVSMIERKDPKSAAEAKEAVEESLNHKLAQTGA